MYLEAPENFDFPFTPYPIQQAFMKHLYEAIETGKLGIFESPTGTGKSLSIICSALRWLKDHNEREHNELALRIKALDDERCRLISDSADWLNSQSQEIEIIRRLNQLKIEQSKIAEYDKKIEKLHRKKTFKLKKTWPASTVSRSDKKMSCGEVSMEKDEEEAEEELLLEDVIPDYDEGEVSDDDEGNKYEPVKVLICSRTHSQLSQFVGEIIKSPFGSNTRAVSLASRQSYCVNSAVAKLKSASLINEKCLDMQNKAKKNSKSDPDGKIVKRQKGALSQCPYKKQQNIENLRDISLLDIQDVEDLVTNARQLNACPYYASRQAAEDAQIVLVPYNTLLHKNTRDASGIKLKNNVVIIDEAHNLLEALAQMYGAEITFCQLEEAHQRLRSYKQKYSTRFSAYNLLCINQLLFVISRLMSVLSKTTNAKSNEIKSVVYTVTDFVLTAEIDNYNMFKLIKFCRDSKLAQKIHSFSNKYPLDLQVPEKAKEKSARSGIQQFLSSIENKKSNSTQQPVAEQKVLKHSTSSGNPFLSYISFMEALTYSYEDGRIIINRSQEKAHSKLQFLLLNPAAQFKDIVKEARSVIVAGGTMKPVSEFRDRLFMGAGASHDRIMEFSCDHIIPPQNILPIIITKCLNQQSLLFNFENRFTMGPSLKQILQEVCKKVTGGIVVFLPSYKYEEWVWQQLQGAAFGKPVFREPKESALVDFVLESYAAAIRKPNSTGAMLFSVVGGKLSEGLNFSDDLGRCVVVVGLPYANINSPELKEKMTYLDNTEAKGAGQKFYEGLCMKSVNQCIGRAVRHRDDYACVLLLDVRYDRVSTKNALPDWIRRSLSTHSFVQALPLIEEVLSGCKKEMDDLSLLCLVGAGCSTAKVSCKLWEIALLIITFLVLGYISGSN